MSGTKTNSGEQLRRQWHIPARQVRYHKDGNWYAPLERFPAALADPEGYLLFPTVQDYAASLYLQIGAHIHVPGGVVHVPGYVRFRPRETRPGPPLPTTDAEALQHLEFPDVALTTVAHGLYREYRVRVKDVLKAYILTLEDLVQAWTRDQGSAAD
jgi:hypothetical protein